MATTQGMGSIIQLEKDKPKNKCRKWQLRVSLGKDPKTGKYHQKTRTVNGSYSQAKAALREFIEEIEENRVQDRTSWTFKAYSDYFLEQRELKKEVAKTTLERQRWQFKAVCMHIGEAKLEAITPAVLNSMYIALLKGETLSGRKAGGSYVNQIHDNIKLVFDLAMKEGMLVENPCLKADPPKMDTKPKKAIGPEAAHVMIAMLDETKAREMAYLIAITMGLRRGEICGLSWKDIDFDAASWTSAIPSTCTATSSRRRPRPACACCRRPTTRAMRCSRSARHRRSSSSEPTPSAIPGRAASRSTRASP